MFCFGNESVIRFNKYIDRVNGFCVKCYCVYGLNVVKGIDFVCVGYVLCCYDCCGGFFFEWWGVGYDMWYVCNFGCKD